MDRGDEFDLTDFLPYLLNQAAEVLSLEFQNTYKGRYGMLRTEWRVLFHLGHYGPMTAKAICDRARLHKTKVSRAVAALETKRYVTRHELAEDRRHAELRITRAGQRVFDDLYQAARDFDARIKFGFDRRDAETLVRCLSEIADLPGSAAAINQRLTE